MSYINKREEFENQNSGRHLFKTDPEMFTKIKDNTFGFWSLSPLSNFNKDAYKTDQIHMNPQYGDKPLDYLSSCEAEVVEGTAPNQMLTQGDSPMLTKGDSPLQIKANYVFRDRSFSPIELYWEKISVMATYKKNKKSCLPYSGVIKSILILNEVSGVAKPGSFTAILGPSGSGKTSLLNFLSNRMMSENFSYSGSLIINGVKVDSLEKIGNQVGYVMQDDILPTSFTPLEVFKFYAEMRMNAPKEKKETKIKDLIQMLGLEQCCNTIIGNSLIRGISGGERKRTSIGVELLGNPSIIFLDEPTTGLDSETALNIVQILKVLAKNGRTVISTIHQPSSSIFMEFDKLILLVKGNIIYQGNALKSIEYFEAMGFSSPPFCNPSTFFMKLISPEGLLVNHIVATHDYDFKLNEENHQEYKKRMIYMIEYYKSSENYKRIKSTLQENFEFDSKMNTVSWFKQFYQILNRGFKNELRNPLDLKMRLTSTLFFSVLQIIVFKGLGSYQNEIQNRRGCIFQLVMHVCFSTINSNSMIFALEKPLFIREKMNRTYSLSAYYWGKTSSEFPFHILFATLVITIVYFVIGLNDTSISKFFILVLIYNVAYFAGVSYGFFLAVVFPKPNIAMSLAPVLVTPFFLTAGFFVNQKNIPYFLYQFEYLSIFKYVYQASFINEFSDKTWYSEPGVEVDPIKDENFDVDMWTCIWLMAIIGMCLRIFGCIILAKISATKKPKLIKTPKIETKNKNLKK